MVVTAMARPSSGCEAAEGRWVRAPAAASDIAADRPALVAWRPVAQAYAFGVSGIEGRRVPRAPVERVSSVPSRARPGDLVLAALSLQRTVGNAGVARLVRDGRLARDARRGSNGAVAAPLRTLQRFAGPEHEELGNTLHTDIDLGHGVTLTWGQVLAIAGDEIGTVGELLGDPDTEAGRHRLGASLLNAEVKGPVAAALTPSDAEKKEHYNAFVLLALENADHFPDSGRAMAAWGRHHSKAVDLALGAGLAGDRHALNVAYAYEAFGQHFLTDCYSGGHIRTPRAQIIDWYQAWASRIADRLIAGLKNRLVEDLVREASPQTMAPDAYLRKYKIEPEVGPAIDDAIKNQAGGVAAFARWLGLGIAGAISGTIHDADGAAGVEVASDDHPDSWLAYGDGKLKSSPVSFAQAAKAIAVAKAEVDRAYAIGVEEGKKASRAGPPDKTLAEAKARVAPRSAHRLPQWRSSSHARCPSAGRGRSGPISRSPSSTGARWDGSSQTRWTSTSRPRSAGSCARSSLPPTSRT
jgi:hypothetical protein